MRIAVVGLALLLASSAFAADIGGAWNATMATPDGQSMNLVFKFQVDGEKLTGSVTSQMGEIELSDGKVAGDTITFPVNVEGFSIVHTGTVDGDEMTIKTDMGDMVAKRTES